MPSTRQEKLPPASEICRWSIPCIRRRQKKQGVVCILKKWVSWLEITKCCWELFGISVSIWHVHFAAKLCSVSLVCSVPQIFLSPTKSPCFSRISRRRASRLRYDISAALKETVGKHGSAEGGPFLGNRGQSIPLPLFFYHLPIRT